MGLIALLLTLLTTVFIAYPLLKKPERDSEIEQEIERQVLELRKVRFCPQCGSRCRKEDKFCSSCGTKLS